MAKGYKKAEPLNRWISMAFVIITIFLGTVFTSEMVSNKPIARKETIEQIGVFKKFTTHGKGKSDIPEISLYLVDGSIRHINHCCVSDEFLKKLENTPKGTEFKLLINPNNNYVVEVVANNKILLDFDKSQKNLEREGVGFLYLGIFLYASAVYFIVQVVLDFKKKIKRKRINNNRQITPHHSD